MKDIAGYEGIYAVTSFGRVWSYINNKFLKPCPDKKGYLCVDLYKDGKRKNIKIHRLVAEAYIPNPYNLPQVNHKDEVKTHNWVNNLEWCDAKYNVNYGTGHERSGISRSIKIKCVETGEEFESIIGCERKTGLSKGSLSEHLHGKRNSVGGLHFERIE